MLARGAAITPENARFFADPMPVVVHIPSVIIFGVLGAFQFSTGFRRRRPAWHRVAGRLLVGFGLASALSGLWMTWVYPYAPPDAFVLYCIRQVVGWAMTVCIVLGFAAARRRDFTRHRAWMIRVYAIGMGAGTQVLTFIVWLLIVGGTQNEASRVLVLSSGWLINVIVAEWIIRRRPARAIQPLVPANEPA